MLNLFRAEAKSFHNQLNSIKFQDFLLDSAIEHYSVVNKSLNPIIYITV